MKIYHGSEVVVNKPSKEKSALTTDYGNGFYCTEYLDLAGEWACKKRNDGYINIYEINEDELRILRLDSKYNILNWLAILADNRLVPATANEAKEYLLENYLIDGYKDFDVIIGYRADDSYYMFVREFLQNTIGISVLNDAMYLGNEGMQVFIQSDRAFDELKFINAIPVEQENYYPLQRNRQDEAETKYITLVQKKDLNDKTILDYMREGENVEESSIPKINTTPRTG